MGDGADGQPVTRLLRAAARGEEHAAEELLPLVYGELRKLAQARLKKTPPGQTLSGTALVHEAYIRLVGGVWAWKISCPHQAGIVRRRS